MTNLSDREQLKECWVDRFDEVVKGLEIDKTIANKLANFIHYEIETAKKNEVARLKEENAEKDNTIKNLSRLLLICRSAIDDAICLEDGLDGSIGQDLIDNINKTIPNLEQLTSCQECDHLIQENLKIGAELSRMSKSVSELKGQDLVNTDTIERLTQQLSRMSKSENCKYASISHGIGLDGKVTEIKLHCSMDSKNDYTEEIHDSIRSMT